MAISDTISKAKKSVGLEDPVASEAEGPVRTVREALQSIGDGDWDGFCGTLEQDVEWIAPGGDFPGGGSLSGRDQVKEKFIGTIERTYATFGFVPESFVAAPDDEIVVFGAFECEGRQGGSRVNEGAVMLWKFDGDHANEVRIYTDSAPFPEPLSEEDEREIEADAKEQESGEQQDEDDSGQDEGEGAQAEGEGAQPEGKSAQGEGDGSGSEDK
jgi:ketosteroid isomerase-like protein